MIVESIRSLIETKLNNNTANKKFVLGTYIVKKDLNREQGYIYNINNGYTLVETDYIPCQASISIDYKPIPNTITGYATCDLTFLVLADEYEGYNTKFLADIDAINEVLPKIIGNFESFTDGSDTYKSVWNMEAITPTGELNIINGHQYVIVRTTIWVDFSDTFYYGNEYTYTINGNSVVGIDGDISRENEEMLPHALNDTEALGDNQTSTWKFDISVFVDSYIDTLIKAMSESTYDMSTVYRVIETTPTGTITHDVKLKSISKPIAVGEKLAVNMIFFKSIDAYI